MTSLDNGPRLSENLLHRLDPSHWLSRCLAPLPPGTQRCWVVAEAPPLSPGRKEVMAQDQLHRWSSPQESPRCYKKHRVPRPGPGALPLTFLAGRVHTRPFLPGSWQDCDFCAAQGRKGLFLIRLKASLYLSIPDVHRTNTKQSQGTTWTTSPRPWPTCSLQGQ